MVQIGIAVIHVRFFAILCGVWSARDGGLQRLTLLIEKPYLGQIEQKNPRT